MNNPSWQTKAPDKLEKLQKICLPSFLSYPKGQRERFSRLKFNPNHFKTSRNSYWGHLCIQNGQSGSDGALFELGCMEEHFGI